MNILKGKGIGAAFVVSIPMCLVITFSVGPHTLPVTVPFTLICFAGVVSQLIREQRRIDRAKREEHRKDVEKARDFRRKIEEEDRRYARIQKLKQRRSLKFRRPLRA